MAIARNEGLSMNEPFGAGLAAGQPVVRVGPLSDGTSVPVNGDVEEIGRTSLITQLAITLLAVGFILGYTWWMVAVVAVPDDPGIGGALHCVNPSVLTAHQYRCLPSVTAAPRPGRALASPAER